MDSQEDREKIVELTKRALKASGHANDVKQLCAFEYLRIQELDLAKDVLLSLVVNDFNAISNAQILSHIYSYQASNGIDKARVQYETLSRFIPSQLLCRIPENGEKFEDVVKKFIIGQETEVIMNASTVVECLVDKFAQRLNRLTQTPSAEGDYPNEFFSDKEYFRKTRYSELESLKLHNQESPSFNKEQVKTEYCKAFNEYINILDSIVHDDDMINLLNTDMTKLLNTLNDYKEDTPVRSFFESIQMSKAAEACNNRFLELLRNNINSCKTIDQIIKIEDKLRTLCNEENLMNYDTLYTKLPDYSPAQKPRILLGVTKDREMSVISVKYREKMKSICSEYKTKIPKGHWCKFYTHGTPEYNEFLRNNKSKIYDINQDTCMLLDQDRVIAFIHFSSINIVNNIDSDIILTDDKLIQLHRHSQNWQAEYKNSAHFLSDALASIKDINIASLYELIEKLKDCRSNFDKEIKQVEEKE